MEKELNGIKELYDIIIKTTYPMKIGDRVLEKGEVVAAFDSIQLGNLKEQQKLVAASGGIHNIPRVFWKSPKPLEITFVNGTFSKHDFEVFNNAGFIKENDMPVELTKRLYLESNENGIITLSNNIKNIFIYDDDRNKINDYNIENNKIINLSPFTFYNIDYTFDYINPYNKFMIGQDIATGFLELECKTQITNIYTNKKQTMILKIPKLKLTSNMNLILGEKASPLVSEFTALGIPTGNKGNEYVLEGFLLDEDIDSQL